MLYVACLCYGHDFHGTVKFCIERRLLFLPRKMKSLTSDYSKWTYRDSEPVPERWKNIDLKSVKLQDRVNFWYLRYLIATSTFMLEPWERRLFDSFLFGFVFMIIYACYLYLPAYGLRFLDHFCIFSRGVIRQSAFTASLPSKSAQCIETSGYNKFRTLVEKSISTSI